ncbi:MAG: fibronectin type III domain-containing protein, partial [Chloroflexota bacterium]|nr:fibronectin type III domain-containing protein [Chloroflexota bacterium]
MQRLPIRLFAPLSALLLVGCEDNHPTDFEVAGIEPSLAKATPQELAAPSSAVATVFSDTRIDVGWQDNATDETKFEIYRSAMSADTTFTLLTSPGAGSTTYSDVGLQPGAKYCYRIRAVRIRGKMILNSAFSNTACPIILEAPSNVTLVGTSNAISVQWRDNTTSENHFEVHRSGGSASGPFALLGTSSANTTWYYDGGLSEGVEHCYIVRAVQVVAGTPVVSPFSDAVCGRAVPGPATGTIATPQNSFVVRVEWTAIGIDFRIDRSRDGGASWTTVGTASNTRSFNDQVVTDAEAPYTEAQVCYRVIAYTPSYNAEPSNTDCTVPPARPTAVVVTAIDENTRELTWTDNSAV